MTRTAIQCGTLLAAVFLAACSANAEMIAHWSFDSDFNDDSPYNNHLTVATGTPTITTASGEHVFGGGALDADSTVGTQEYLSLTNPITFGASDAWSVAFWARRRPGTDDRSGMVIGHTNKQDFIWLANNPNQVEGLRFRSTANANANFDGFPDDGQFHHWVVIADGSGNVAAYRDNVPQTPVAATSDFNITSVAHAYNATTQSMDGQIDELYVFDEAIGSDVVASLFNSNQVPEPSTFLLAIAAALGGFVILRRRK